MISQNTGRPWHLWLIGSVSICWNSFGGYYFYITQTANAEYLRPMTEPCGVKLNDALAYVSFSISLIGPVGTFGWSLTNPAQGLTDNPVAYLKTEVVCLLIVLQILYCRRMTTRGVLR